MILVILLILSSLYSLNRRCIFAKYSNKKVLMPRTKDAFHVINTSCVPWFRHLVPIVIQINCVVWEMQHAHGQTLFKERLCFAPFLMKDWVVQSHGLYQPFLVYTLYLHVPLDLPVDPTQRKHTRSPSTWLQACIDANMRWGFRMWTFMSFPTRDRQTALMFRPLRRC
jgi:hypothetical protein